METFMNWWELDHESINILVKDRISKRFGDIWSFLSVRYYLPGYVVHTRPKVNDKLLTHLGCGFCHHIPSYPRGKYIMKCNDCETFYCWVCAKLLSVATQKCLGNPAPNSENFEKNIFTCARCRDIRFMHRVSSSEQEEFHKIIVKCPNSSCQFSGAMVDVQRHREYCQTNGQFKVGSILNYLHQIMKEKRKVTVVPEQDEIIDATTEEFLESFDRRLMASELPELLEPRDGFKAFKRNTDGNIISMIKARKINKPDNLGTPVRAQSLILPQIMKSILNLSKIAGLPDFQKVLSEVAPSTSTHPRPSSSIDNYRERKNQHELSNSDSLDPDAKLEIEAQTPNGTDGALVERPNPLSRNLPKSMLPAFVRMTTPRSIPEIIADDSLDETVKKKRIHRRRQDETRLLKGKVRGQALRREDKIKQFLAERSNPNNAFSLRNNIHGKRIFEAVKNLKEHGLKVCSLDVEKCTVATRSGPIQMPIWICVIDMSGAIVINELVRYPKDSILDLMIKFHGVSWDTMQGARHIDIVRRKVIDALIEYDRIVIAGGSTDFVSLGFDTEDWEFLQPRIRDVNYYYNIYQNAPMLSLKYIYFALFAEIIQEDLHSPFIDAGCALLAYLIDYEKFEETHARTTIKQ